MPRFKDNAVCIRHIDWSETSQVVALFTERHGKVRGLAKGSKRTSPGAVARFSGGIELLTRGQVVATVKQTTDLAAITEWDLQEPHRHLHTDLEAHRLAMYAADVANALTEEHDPHPRGYAALVRFLTDVAKPQAAWRRAALLRLQWVMLDECGYKPELERDAVTGEALAAKPASGSSRGAAALWFDALAGGLTGEARQGGYGRGRIADAGPWRVRGETVELLQRVHGQAESDADASLNGAEADSLHRANRLLCVYIRAILDRELPTMAHVLGKGL